MKTSELKVGDHIRITGVPSPNGGIMPRETKRVFRMLAARNRSVRISRIDEHGVPWYSCRFRRPDGSCEYHDLALFEEENWVFVTFRK